MGAPLPTVKRYRQAMIKDGLLEARRGIWLKIPPIEGSPQIPKGSPQIPKGSPQIPSSSPKGISTDPQRDPHRSQEGSPQIPSPYNGTSASSSTSSSAKASKRARAMTLKDLDEDRRPDMRGREERGGGGEGWVSVEVWSERWEQATGQRWPRSWRSWAGVVLPLLAKAEREELVRKGEELGGKNLPFWTAVVERLVRESSSASSTRRGGGGGAGRRLPGEEHFPQTYIDERDQFWDKLQERGRR